MPTPSSSANADARRLAAGVARGDEAAFREFYDRYEARLFRFGLALGHGDEGLAGEVVQAVFVSAATSLRGVESEEHLWNWLARVARQQVAKAWRERRQRSPVVGMAELPDYADPRASDSLLEEKLDAVLLTIDPEERQMIEWFYFDGLSHKEIAAWQHATSKAVSSRLERARARLCAPFSLVPLPMKPEKQQLIQHLLADAEDLRRQATLSSCGPILRRRRWQRRRRSLTMITLLALAALSLPRWVPPRKPILTAVAPAQGAGLRSLTDAELLALFPATPVGLVTLENGRKRLIFPRPGDEARFVRHL